MNITIIGAGKMGRALGYRFIDGGHAVSIIPHKLEDGERLAQELNTFSKKGVLATVSTLENAELGDVVVLALHYGDNKEVARQLGSRLAGKIIIDISNPLNSKMDAVETESGRSSPEEIAEIVPSSAKVIKAFNNVTAGSLVNGKMDDIPLEIFYAGDDPQAKESLGQLVQDGGMVPIDIGPLVKARGLEWMALIFVTLLAKDHWNGASTMRYVSPSYEAVKC